MKTPREILLGKHQSIEPRLDALREQFVAGVSAAPSKSAPPRAVGAVASEGFGWGELILMVRWHLAGLAAMWLLIGVLRVAGGAADTPSMAQRNVTLPRTVILALKENRRRILEFGNAPTVSVSPSQAAPRSHHSYRQIDWANS
jgi:hypothetical protein